MNWKSITTIGLLVLVTAFAVYAGNDYLCPAVNHCDKVNSWQESGVALTQYNCYIKNIGRGQLKNIAMRLSGAQVKQIWEVETTNKGNTWNFVPWRKAAGGLSHGESHTWGYVVYGNKPLEVNICSNECYDCNHDDIQKQQKANVNCNLSNNCTQANQWKNGDEVNTQYNCLITNNSPNPVSFIDIRINGNQDLFNVWEIITPNNGLSWDLKSWRIESPLESSKSHSWGYIVKGDKPLDIQVCENGPVASASIKQQHVSKSVQNQTASISCFVSNNCTLAKEWKNDAEHNKQYSCEITNNGKVPLSHVDIRISNNTALYNVWEIITPNNGLSFDLVPWRIEEPLLPGMKHQWGYIVKDNVELDVKVCQMGTA